MKYKLFYHARLTLETFLDALIREQGCSRQFEQALTFSQLFRESVNLPGQQMAGL
jgi:hypothetical protein